MTRGGERQAVELTGVERQQEPKPHGRGFGLPGKQDLCATGREQIGDPDLQGATAPQISVAAVQDYRDALLGHRASSSATRTKAPRASRNTGPRPPGR